MLSAGAAAAMLGAGAAYGLGGPYLLLVPIFYTGAFLLAGGSAALMAMMMTGRP